MARRFTFRAHLVAFAMLVALPVTIFAWLLLAHSIDVARTQAQARLTQLAAANSANIDREMERHVLVLKTLSTSPAFGDWPAFYDRARRALQGDGYILVLDRGLRQLVNTYVPYGRQPARTGDIETAERVIASGRPEASDVFTSLVTRGDVINFDMPIVDDGEVVYVLNYGRPVEHIAGILQGQALERGWSSAVFDRDGRVIATSTGATQIDGVELGVSGLTRLTNAAGTTVLRATHVSTMTGWTVAVDVPLSVVNREVNRGLVWWIIFAVATVFAAIMLGIVFGHFLSRQLNAAAAYAVAMGREAPTPNIGSTSLAEIEAIRQALQGARSELNQRIDQQRRLSQELNHRVKNLLSVVQAIVRRTFSDSRPMNEVRELLAERIGALSRSQDILLQSDLGVLPLKQIVEMETASFADRIRSEGSNVLVGAQGAQNFVLLLHELTTNAIKYGALRSEAGVVDVCWDVTGDGRFTFRWKEKCEPVVRTGERSGFGTSLLKSLFPESLCRMEIETDGLVYELNAPLSALGAAQDGMSVG